MAVTWKSRCFGLITPALVYLSFALIAIQVGRELRCSSGDDFYAAWGIAMAPVLLFAPLVFRLCAKRIANLLIGVACVIAGWFVFLTGALSYVGRCVELLFRQ
jgi:hypothetical protein